jgi:integrase/recombinase XerC
MSRDKLAPKYKDGERACPICKNPLPAHQVWPGARHRFCGKQECAQEIKKNQCRLYVEPNDRKCEAGECDKFIPEGSYEHRPSYLSCSAECWYRRMRKGNLVLVCACGCGKQVLRPCKRESVNGLVFFSRQHCGDYLSGKYVNESCGAFQEMFREYIGGFAALHYRNRKDVRKILCPFFRFLTEQGITSLEAVSPKIITDFLSWARTTGHLKAAHDISTVSVFFKWAISMGNRTAANPVIGLIHSTPKKHRSPRPIEDSELDLMWHCLNERGTPRLRLAAAIGVEAGLRIGEICRVHVEDIDPLRQTIFVRLPNKTNRERTVNFSSDTKRYFIDWMAVREPACGHNYLFHNYLGSPLQTRSLADEFKRVLCKTYEGKMVNEIGFDKWSTHRLRHTMASRLVVGGADLHTVMAQGGWVSADSAAGYAQVNSEVARRGYDEAMRLSKEKRLSEPVRRTLTVAEFVSRSNGKSQDLKVPNHQETGVRERCV